MGRESLNVLPGFTPRNGIHVTPTDAKVGSNVVRIVSQFHPGADSPNIVRRQLGIGVDVSLEFRWGRATALFAHVAEVLPVCAEEKVVRVAAGRIIAPVTDVIADWDGTDMKLIAESVHIGEFPANRKYPIAGSCARGLPFPATTTLGHECLLAKAIGGGSGCVMPVAVASGFAHLNANAYVVDPGERSIVAAPTLALSVFSNKPVLSYPGRMVDHLKTPFRSEFPRGFCSNCTGFPGDYNPLYKDEFSVFVRSEGAYGD